MIWPWSKPQTKPKAPTTEKTSTIEVFNHHGKIIASFSCPTKGASRVYPWMQFVKWYHSRPQSANYTFRYDKGQLTIRRVDISRFSIYDDKRLTEAGKKQYTDDPN